MLASTINILMKVCSQCEGSANSWYRRCNNAKLLKKTAKITKHNPAMMMPSCWGNRKKATKNKVPEIKERTANWVEKE